MRFLEVRGERFGPFRDQSLTLRPGLNVLHGPNEAGKSSWFLATYAGLVGRRSGRGRGTKEEAEFRSQTTPWSGGGWRVGVTVELDDGRSIAFAHNLRSADCDVVIDGRKATKRQDAEFLEMLDTDGTVDGAKLIGLDRATVRSTIYVAQADVLRVLEDADELQTFLEAAATSGGLDVTADAALAFVDEHFKEHVNREHIATRPLGQAIKAVDTADAAATEARDEHTSLLRTWSELASLRQNLDRAEQRIDLLRRALNWQEIDELTARIDTARTYTEATATETAPPADDETRTAVADAVAAVRSLGPAPALPEGPTVSQMQAQLEELPASPDGDVEPHATVVEAHDAVKSRLAERKSHDRNRPEPTPEQSAAADPDRLRKIADTIEAEPPADPGDLQERLHGLKATHQKDLEAHEQARAAYDEAAEQRRQLEVEHSEAQAAWEAADRAHRENVEQLRAAHAQALAEHEEERQRREAAHRTAVDEYEEELAARRERHRVALNNYEEKRAAAEQRYDDAIRAHEREVTQLRAEHEQAVAAYHAARADGSSTGQRSAVPLSIGGILLAVAVVLAVTGLLAIAVPVGLAGLAGIGVGLSRRGATDAPASPSAPPEPPQMPPAPTREDVGPRPSEPDDPERPPSMEPMPPTPQLDLPEPPRPPASLPASDVGEPPTAPSPPEELAQLQVRIEQLQEAREAAAAERTQALAWLEEHDLPRQADDLRQLARDIEQRDERAAAVERWNTESAAINRALQDAESALDAALRDRGVETPPAATFQELGPLVEGYVEQTKRNAEQATAAGRREDLEAALEQREARERDHAAAMERRSAVEQHLIERIASVGIPVEAVDDAVDAATTWLEDQRARAQQQSTAREAEARLEELLSETTLEELEATLAARTQSAGERPSEHVAEAESELEQLVSRREAILERTNSLEGALATAQARLPSVAAAIETAAEAQRELDRVRDLEQVIELTEAQLVAAKELAHASIAPVLERSVRSRISLVTEGRYDDVRVDAASLEVEVRSGAGQWREANLLSHGTTEQVYLLLRMALAEALARDDETAPLVLDDVTVQSDRQRTTALLELLLELSSERQVVLFTQEDEVTDWARERLAEGRHQVAALPDLA